MTKEALEIQEEISALKAKQFIFADATDNDILEEIADIEEYIITLKSKICNYCQGEGEVIDQLRVHGNTIDIPYKTCPECNGTGLNEKTKGIKK